MAGSPTSVPKARASAWYHPWRLAQSISVCGLLIYFGLLTLLYTMQTELIYVGSTEHFTPDQAAMMIHRSGLVPWSQTTSGATAPQGFVRPDFEQPAPRGTIVVFHGNGEQAWQLADVAEVMTQRGFRVFLYQYPGYGNRPGRPSEIVIVPDARALVASLVKAGYGPVYMWGQSLGSGVASAVCADKTLPIQGLTLIVPFDTIRNVAAGFYPLLPVRYLMSDEYNSVANLQDFTQPICVIRGDQDDTVVPARTLNLFAHLPGPKKMILMAGHGHGDWSYGAKEAWWDEALDFIAPKK